MATDSPVAILFNTDGYEVNVKPNITIPSGTSAIIAGGSDSGTARFLSVDSSGRPIIAGAGIAGTPAGGVVTIQGIVGGVALPISGSITASNSSIGSNGSAIPTSSTQIGVSDGTNLQVPRGYDLDTGGGTQYNLGVNLRLSSSGGSVEFGTNTNPIRIDPTGTTIQPVSGTVAATQSGTWTVQPGNTANTTPWLSTINQGGNSATVTVSNALKVDGSAVTQPVSGTVTANAGTGNFTIIGTATDNTTNSTSKLPVIAAVSTTTAPTYTTGNMVPLSVDTAGALRVTGSITANNASVSTTGTAPPASATYIGGSVTTAAPTYTTGQMNALSLTTAGSLRVDGSGSTQPVSGTVTSNQGTANTLANRWPVIVTDGTNTMPTGDVAARGVFNRITDGTNTAAVKAASTAAVDTDPALVVAVSPNNTSFTRDREFATFTALATGIALGNNKSMFSIENTTGSAVKCRIHEIYMINVQTSGVTGVVTTFQLRRATSHAAGTPITAIETMETTDTLDSSITARTNATITGESATLLWRALWSSDDWGTGGADVESNAHDFQTMFPIYSRKTQGLKPIILNANETLTIKCATNTTAGTFDLLVVFTQE